MSTFLYLDLKIKNKLRVNYNLFDKTKQISKPIVFVSLPSYGHLSTASVFL